MDIKHGQHPYPPPKARSRCLPLTSYSHVRVPLAVFMFGTRLSCLTALMWLSAVSVASRRRCCRRRHLRKPRRLHKTIGYRHV